MQYVNRAKHLVFVPLNSGERVHLGPSEVTRRLEKSETDGNAQLQRLVASGVLVEIPDAEPEKKSSRAPKAST